MGTQTGAIGAEATSGEGHITGYGTKAYRSYVLNALLVVYILNFLDRGLLGIVSDGEGHGDVAAQGDAPRADGSA